MSSESIRHSLIITDLQVQYLTTIIMFVSRVSISNHWPDELDTTDQTCAAMCRTTARTMSFIAPYIYYTLHTFATRLEKLVLF